MEKKFEKEARLNQINDTLVSACINLSNSFCYETKNQPFTLIYWLIINAQGEGGATRYPIVMKRPIKYKKTLRRVYWLAC